MKNLVLFLVTVAICTCASAQVSVITEDEPRAGGAAHVGAAGHYGTAVGPQACRDIEHEARLLERSIRAHQKTLDKATTSLTLAGTEIAASASQTSTGAALGAGLHAGVSTLGMVPGMGTLGVLAAGAATSTLSPSQSPHPSLGGAHGALQSALEAQQALYSEEARHQHLVGLFLDKRCPLSE